MRIPTMRGLIDRRILAKFHVDPNVLARVLPPPFRPQLAGSYPGPRKATRAWHEAGEGVETCPAGSAD